MGKKARPAILASAPKLPEEDEYDEDAEAEAAALADLEAERQAEEMEEEFAGGDEGAQGGGVIYNRAGLEAATAELEARGLPWIERLDVCAGEKVEVADVHDDLAREMAFYDLALGAVKEARARLKADGISWKRPEDFFCEMVKSDTHMAKIKDRLIFEQKKMEAFESRKQRQSQKKFAKARAADLEGAKSAAKKENIESLEKWRRDNKEKRKHSGGALEDGDAELDHLMEDADDKGIPGKSRKRKNMDRKYGMGGVKNKKATRNDEKGLNNSRDFNPKRMKAEARDSARANAAQRGKRPGKDARSQKRQTNRTKF